MSNLDPRAVERISGPAWSDLRTAVLEVAEVLLAASPKARSELTTIYVKFERPDGSVYAVMWLKKSSEAVVGLTLPEDSDGPELHPAPTGMKYKGLTRYFTIRNGSQVPMDLAAWVAMAFAEDAPSVG